MTLVLRAHLYIGKSLYIASTFHFEHSIFVHGTHSFTCSPFSKWGRALSRDSHRPLSSILLTPFMFLHLFYLSRGRWGRRSSQGWLPLSPREFIFSSPHDPSIPSHRISTLRSSFDPSLSIVSSPIALLFSYSRFFSITLYCTCVSNNVDEMIYKCSLLVCTLNNILKIFYSKMCQSIINILKFVI